jgi:hypothetical protein
MSFPCGSGAQVNQLEDHMRIDTLTERDLRIRSNLPEDWSGTRGLVAGGNSWVYPGPGLSATLNGKQLPDLPSNGQVHPVNPLLKTHDALLESFPGATDHLLPATIIGRACWACGRLDKGLARCSGGDEASNLCELTHPRIRTECDHW